MRQTTDAAGAAGYNTYIHNAYLYAQKELLNRAMTLYTWTRAQYTAAAAAAADIIKCSISRDKFRINSCRSLALWLYIHYSY